ncbi:MAG TPA: methyltransferase domain-containing protein [Clostridia bacterium]|nr:methyltransferase domain-containing protein [Clostridia bacterium]
MSNPINPDILYNEHFPLSNKYDPAWILDNQMGPNPLWLAEFLTKPFDLKPGMRVLDLGCGRGMTSVFLAREFGVQVYAVDLWDNPDKKWENAKAFGVEHLIVPIQADARSLPFAQGFFDAVICVDAYIYFGAEEGYLENLLKFLRPNGQLGMIVPGYMKEVTGGVPEHITKFLNDELWTWQSLPWWKNHWEKTGLVSIDAADTMPNGCNLWLRWDAVLLETGKNHWGDETEYFRIDNGEYIGFIRLVATKK